MSAAGFYKWRAKYGGMDTSMMARLKAEIAREVIAKKVAPSRRKEAAQKVFEHRRVSIRIVCAALGISESCYHYQPQLSGENGVIADWPVCLATA